MKKSFHSRFRNDLFPKMPQSYADGLQRALTRAGANPRKLHLRTVLSWAAAAALLAVCALLIVFGVYARTQKRSRALASPGSFGNGASLIDTWQVTQYDYNGVLLSAQMLGGSIRYTFNEDGTAVLSQTYEEDVTLRYSIEGNTVHLERTDGQSGIKVDGPLYEGEVYDLRYDPDTDTLTSVTSAQSETETPVLSQSLAVVLMRVPKADSAVQKAVGTWVYTFGADYAQRITIRADGTATLRQTAGMLSTLDVSLTYTVSDGVLTFSGTDIRFAARCNEDDTLTVAQNGEERIFTRAPLDLVGVWTLSGAEMYGNRVDADSLSGLFSIYLEFTDDGVMTLTGVSKSESIQECGHYTVNGYEITVTDENGDPLMIRYDPGTDTLSMDDSDLASFDVALIFSRTPDAVIPEVRQNVNVIGKWTMTEFNSADPRTFGVEHEVWLEFFEGGAAAVTEQFNSEITITSCSYSVTGDTVIIEARNKYQSSSFNGVDGKAVYDPDTDTLHFENGNDKMVFSRTPNAQIPGSEIGIVDPVIYDVDGDGQPETCQLGYGPTSGLFTAVLTVSRDGTVVCKNTFNMEYGTLSFVQKNGALLLKRIPQDSTEERYYAIKIEDGAIVLTDEKTGEAVPYWGAADPTWNMNVPTTTPEKWYGGAWYCYDKGLASYPGYDELLLIEFDPDGKHVSFTEDRKHYEGYSWQTDAINPNVLILTDETTGDVRRATLETASSLRLETEPNASGERSEWTYYSLPVLSSEDLPFGEAADLWFGTIVAAASGTDHAWCNGPLGMFDLDGDGKPELIRLTWKETDRKMTVEAIANHNRAAYTEDTLPGEFGTNEGELCYTVENVTSPGNMILIDLDPNDGHVNLLVSAYTENGEYTYELHVENGEFICGHVIEGYCYLEDREEDDRVVRVPTLVVQTDLFGADGYREVRGEALEPVDDRLYASAIVDAIYFGSFGSGREKHIEDGTLLHLVRALPCEIDGVAGTLEPGVYIYLCQWNEALTEIIFSTEDWQRITVHPDAGLMLDGVSLYDYFDNAPEVPAA